MAMAIKTMNRKGITPEKICVSLTSGGAIAPPEVKLTQIFSGVMPFLFMVFIAMAIVYIFPQIVYYLPTVFYGG